jgi:hypothetical protein
MIGRMEFIKLCLMCILLTAIALLADMAWQSMVDPVNNIDPITIGE